MCGRYASSRQPDDLAEEFEIDRARAAESVPEPHWPVPYPADETPASDPERPVYPKG